MGKLIITEHVLCLGTLVGVPEGNKVQVLFSSFSRFPTITPIRASNLLLYTAEALEGLGHQQHPVSWSQSARRNQGTHPITEWHADSLQSWEQVGINEVWRQAIQLKERLQSPREEGKPHLGTNHRRARQGLAACVFGKLSIFESQFSHWQNCDNGTNYPGAIKITQDQTR